MHLTEIQKSNIIICHVLWRIFEFAELKVVIPQRGDLLFIDLLNKIHIDEIDNISEQY